MKMHIYLVCISSRYAQAIKFRALSKIHLRLDNNFQKQQ